MYNIFPDLVYNISHTTERRSVSKSNTRWPECEELKNWTNGLQKL